VRLIIGEDCTFILIDGIKTREQCNTLCEEIRIAMSYIVSLESGEYDEEGYSEG